MGLDADVLSLEIFDDVGSDESIVHYHTQRRTFATSRMHHVDECSNFTATISVMLMINIVYAASIVRTILHFDKTI